MFKSLLEIIEYAITVGERAWENGCSPCFAHCYYVERPVCGYLSIPNLSSTDQERHQPLLAAGLGSHPTDWIIQIIVFLQRQKTQLIRGSSSVCPSFSMETARALLGLLQAAHLGPTFYIL